MPGKLADCQSRDAKECEIYTLLRETQLVVVLSKVEIESFKRSYHFVVRFLNVEKSHLHKILKSEQISNVITALRCGIDNEFDASKLRYHKIIVMTDADVDGSHIQTLLLTFFYRFLRPVIEHGFLYIAQPPLYRYKKGKQEILS